MSKNFRPLVSDLFLGLIALAVMIGSALAVVLVERDHWVLTWGAGGFLALALLQVVSLIYLARRLQA